MMRLRCRWLKWGALLVWGILATGAAGAEPMNWKSLAPGLELGRFGHRTGAGTAEVQIVVVRIDPDRWDLRLGLASETDGVDGLSAREWARHLGFAAVINAGMFATDYLTHIGYLQHREHVNNPRLSRYQSLAAFCPKSPEIVPFRIFDMDAPDFSLDEVKHRYGCMVQNLRLIKRPGENRWEAQPKTWIEAALGEDRQGRALMIFSRTPQSMHALNEALLALPLQIVCAQHLEGGPEAQLFVSVGDFSLEIIGGYENRSGTGTILGAAWPLPNVIGVMPKP
ncbi:MAG: phosphodiester glycosidase family protein [Desulfobacteraceae bacterium]|jgi:hypothetical protein|nr:phosphodiester glycosidase family protein [Desulfobacteraceae bacterium]MDD3991486.1 phosphodiester glycosidase family protein [Desulfobacteraceae bacterium]